MVNIRKVLEEFNSKFRVKSMFFLLTIILIILLSSCDYSYHLFYNDDKEVTLVELISYTCNDAVEHIEIGEYNPNSFIILESLEEAQIEIFIEELSEIGGISSRYKNIVENPCGTGIEITYEDDSFTVITVYEDSDAIYLGEYDSESELQDFFGINRQDIIDDFTDLIEVYFNNTTE